MGSGRRQEVPSFRRGNDRPGRNLPAAVACPQSSYLGLRTCHLAQVPSLPWKVRRKASGAPWPPWRPRSTHCCTYISLGAARAPFGPERTGRGEHLLLGSLLRSAPEEEGPQGPPPSEQATHVRVLAAPLSAQVARGHLCYEEHIVRARPAGHGQAMAWPMAGQYWPGNGQNTGQDLAQPGREWPVMAMPAGRF